MKKSNIAKIALVFILIGPMYAGPVKWAKSKVLHRKSHSFSKDARSKSQNPSHHAVARTASAQKLKKRPAIKRAARWVKSKILHRKSYALPKELSPKSQNLGRNAVGQEEHINALSSLSE